MSVNYKAIIDLGSLKAKLSLFDIEKLELIKQKSYLTLLGKGISNTHTILPDSLKRLDEAMQEIIKDCKEKHVDNFVVIATEAMRVANNQIEVHNIIDKYLPGVKIQILDSTQEGQLFFESVAKCFPDKMISVIDIGGGSVQITHGQYNSKANTYSDQIRKVFQTGTYRLQQRFSPDNSIISENFEQAKELVEQAFYGMNFSSEILVFGSTCMLDFINASGIQIYNEKPYPKHPTYTTLNALEQLLDQVRILAPKDRTYIYPGGEYFMHGADYLLINLITLARLIQASNIYPTNLNSSYGLI